MTARHRHTAIGRARGRLAVALGACALAGGSLLAGVPVAAASTASVSQQQPDQVIDASDPTQQQEAGKALDLCATLSNCQWVGSDTTTAWGPQHIIGDAAYNCSDSTNRADTIESAYSVEETREESTSVQETVKFKTSLSFIGLVKASAEFSAFSKQLSSFSTSVETTIAFTLLPGYWGYRTWSVWGAHTTGSAYVTDGIKLIQVKDIQLDFPGFYNTRTDANASKISYTTHKFPMTDAQFDQFCHQVTGATRPATAASFKLTLCDGGDCNAQTVTGPRPPSVRRATAVISDTATGRILATGALPRGRMRLKAHQPIPSGANYQLTIKEPAAVKGRGRVRTRFEVRTHVPITMP